MNCSVEIYYDANPDVKLTGSLEVMQYSLHQRRARALKAWGLIWGLTLAAVFVPVVHFFAVPIGILTGPIVGWWVYHMHAQITGGNITCPKCNQGVKVEKQQPRWPVRELCTSCQTEFKVAPKEAVT